MSAGGIKVEQLDSGLRAAFVNLPHFRTHSARFTVGAGSVHETPDAYGAAHFLEHITFQGTEAMPHEADVHRYTEEKGLTQNAFTSQMFTTYIADGYDLESVGFFVTQLGLRPVLTTAALEGERKPIVDELRGYASSPFFNAGIAHARATRGELYSRPTGGTIEDVQRMTPEALRSFHQRHYRLGNAVLVLCSSEPVERQREFTETLMAGYKEEGVDQPAFVELGNFNPDNLAASLQRVDLPLTAQSSVSISYGMPETTSFREQLSYTLVSMILSKVAHNRLRRELALCYGAKTGVSILSDSNFGRNKSWSHFTATANLNGEDAVTGLETLHTDVLHRPLPENVFKSSLLALHRDVDHVMQSNPAQIASRVRNILTLSKRDEVALDEVEDFAKTISLGTLRKLHTNLTDTKPLVLATSPDQAVLDSVGDWADSKIA
ncbi:MAG: pitrilysin family protein [Candidatus Saccharimonadales bacterium]